MASINRFLNDHGQIRQIRAEYEKKAALYRAFGNLIRLYLEEGLNANNVSYTDIQLRVKTFHSFLSKIKRKKYYDDPYVKIEDICGVRVICTFKEDLIKVTDLIEGLFDADPPDDKENHRENLLSGYRGIHQIVQLKKEICESSDFYSKLDGLKSEIQIRTIVQHSWSEISHKLNYKDDENVPTEFKTLLSEISANLSMVDRLYNDLKAQKKDLRERLIEKKVGGYDLDQELNADTLTTFLEIFFPERDDCDDVDLLYEELKSNSFSFRNIVEHKRRLPDGCLSQIDQEILGTGHHTQVGIVRLVLSLFYDDYWKHRKKILLLYPDGKKRIMIIEKWQKRIKNGEIDEL